MSKGLIEKYTLPEITLAFAREVMGWADAYHSGDGYIVSPGQNKSDCRVWEPHHSMDLSIVMQAAKDWCKQRRLSIEFIYLCTSDAYHAAVIGRRCHDESATNAANPCEAIMAACIAADRKLKGDTGS